MACSNVESMSIACSASRLFWTPAERPGSPCAPPRNFLRAPRAATCGRAERISRASRATLGVPGRAATQRQPCGANDDEEKKCRLIPPRFLPERNRSPSANAAGKRSWTLLRAAVIVWTLMTLALCARSAITPHKQNVFPMWKVAGSDWLTSHDLYEAAHPIRYGYRYAPTIATAYIIWGVVPERVGNVLWRLINAATFLAAFSWWLRAGISVPTTVRQRGICYLLAAPLALGSLNNGQPNPLLIA